MKAVSVFLSIYMFFAESAFVPVSWYEYWYISSHIVQHKMFMMFVGAPHRILMTVHFVIFPLLWHTVPYPCPQIYIYTYIHVYSGVCMHAVHAPTLYDPVTDGRATSECGHEEFLEQPSLPALETFL